MAACLACLCPQAPSTILCPYYIAEVTAARLRCSRSPPFPSRSPPPLRRRRRSTRSPLGGWRRPSRGATCPPSRRATPRRRRVSVSEGPTPPRARSSPAR
eukprot:2207247-Prymnesium_polylepis.1